MSLLASRIKERTTMLPFAALDRLFNRICRRLHLLRLELPEKVDQHSTGTFPDVRASFAAAGQTFDVIGSDIQKRSAGLILAGGTLVSIVMPTKARPADGLAVD